MSRDYLSRPSYQGLALLTTEDSVEVTNLPPDYNAVLKTPVVATITVAGDTVVHTPTLGRKIRLFWVSAINDPDEATTPLIDIRIGSLTCYRGYALAHWEIFDGAIDAPLIVSLGSVGSVAFTAHLVEVA